MRRDNWIIIATLALAGLYLYATAQIKTVPIGDPLGPRVYPALLGGGLIIAALMMVLEQRRAAPAPIVTSADAAPADCPAAEPAPSILPSRAVMGAIAWTALFFILFEPLGYLIGGTLYLFGLVFVFNPGRHKTNAAVALLFTAATYLLFNELLGVSLPPGPLPF